jgi:hypothetical protein
MLVVVSDNDNHYKKTVTLAFPRCGEVFVVTEAERFGHAIRKNLFRFFGDFFPSFLVREDPNLCRCVLLYVSGRCRE